MPRRTDRSTTVATPGQPRFTRRFELDQSLLAPGSATAITIGGGTSFDILSALDQGSPLPPRELNFGQFSVEAEGAVHLNGRNIPVAFDYGGSNWMRLSVVDSAARVRELLENQGLPLTEEGGTRYLVLNAGYRLGASASGLHPVGLLGSADFAFGANRRKLAAVVHRFPEDKPAGEVFADCFHSFRLPVQVNDAEDLKPGTMLTYELDGAASLRLGAQFGYDFTFLRQARLLGLTGDIGLRIEAGLRATLGLSVSDRFQVTLDRPATDGVVRLRLQRAAGRGWNFGLDLAAVVQGRPDILPDRVDDLIRAAFSVHGMQVLRDLQTVMGRWLGPGIDLSRTVAGLDPASARSLLAQVTGIDPMGAFDQARQSLVTALTLWNELPERVSGPVWSLLPDLPAVRTALGLLGSETESDQIGELRRFFESPGYAATPIGRLLDALSGGRPLTLLDRLAEVRQVAGTVSRILDGGEIARLQRFVNERLDLERLRAAASESDLRGLDAWLVNRLSTLWRGQPNIDGLCEVQQALGALLAQRQSIYEQGRNALARRYDFAFAYAYQRSDERTALLDASFDLDRPPARELFGRLLRDGDVDAILTTEAAGVTLHEGVLTHHIARSARIAVSLPSFDFQSETINKSFARVTAREEGGRVLLYDFEATEETRVRNRFRSQLAAAGSVLVPVGSSVRIYEEPSGSWSYQYRLAREKMGRQELERQLAPLTKLYFPEHFTSLRLSDWLDDIDRRVGIHDVLLSLEVSVGPKALGAWLRPRGRDELRSAKAAVSRALQRALKRLLPFYYLEDLARLHRDQSCAGMLVYASIPPSVNIRLRNGKLTIDADDRKPYWDSIDPDKRQAMANNPLTLSGLREALDEIRLRLEAAGRDAKFFQSGEETEFLKAAEPRNPNGALASLLRLESVIVDGASKALEDLSKFQETADRKPTAAIDRLARFGAEVTKTFHERIESRFGRGPLRALGSMLFVEASHVLDPKLSNAPPNALLSLTILKQNRTFQVADYLAGQEPEAGEIALAERLLHASA